MYTAIIAEDEILVRLGLSISVPWAQYGVLVIAECANGQDAYDAYLKHRPDIVITDLRMPGISGLDLIGRIRRQDARCAIIVITALMDFEPLHEAMRLDVTAYLIKATMTTKEIQEAIEKACRELRLKGAGEADTAAREAAGLQKRIITRCLFDSACNDEHSLAALAERFCSIKSCALITLTPAAGSGELNGMTAQSARRLALEALITRAPFDTYEHEDHLLFVASNAAVEVWEIADWLRESDAYIREHFARGLRVYHCPSAVEPRRLPAWIDAARRASTRDVSGETEGIAVEAAPDGRIVSAQPPAVPIANSNANPMERVTQYMKEHLSDNMSLTQMAAMVNLSPSYFSTLLKKETGRRFADYLCDLRVRHAQTLLRDRRLSVQQVAEMCGLSDIAYFSRVFKRKTGQSPSQWRRA